MTSLEAGLVRRSREICTCGHEGEVHGGLLMAGACGVQLPEGEGDGEQDMCPCVRFTWDAKANDAARTRIVGETP